MSYRQRSAAPIVVRHGHFVLHINDVSQLETVLTTMRGSHTTTSNSEHDLDVLASLGQSALEVIAAATGTHFSSLRHALTANRDKVPRNLMKKLERINTCASFARHYTTQYGKEVLSELGCALAASCEHTSENNAEAESADERAAAIRILNSDVPHGLELVNSSGDHTRDTTLSGWSGLSEESTSSVKLGESDRDQVGQEANFFIGEATRDVECQTA